MKNLTAKRSLTLSSERCNPSFGRKNNVSRTQVAPKGDSPERGGSNGQLDLSACGAQSRMVLQMVEPLSGRRSGGSAGSFACPENQSVRMVAGDVSSHPSNSRP